MNGFDKTVSISAVFAKLNDFPYHVTHELLETNREIFHASMLRNLRGNFVSENEFPSLVELSDRRLLEIGFLGDLFCVGFWVVSERCKEVLSRFDLGEVDFYPLRVSQPQFRRNVPGTYFSVCFASKKTAVEIEQSLAVRKYRNQDGHHVSSQVLDGQIAVSPCATDGADLWIDPGLDNAVFLSGKLVAALKESDLSEPWRLRKCHIVVE